MICDSMRGSNPSIIDRIELMMSRMKKIRRRTQMILSPVVCFPSLILVEMKMMMRPIMIVTIAVSASDRRSAPRNDLCNDKEEPADDGGDSHYPHECCEYIDLL